MASWLLIQVIGECLVTCADCEVDFEIDHVEQINSV